MNRFQDVTFFEAPDFTKHTIEMDISNQVK